MCPCTKENLLLLLGNCCLRPPSGLPELAESSAILTVLQDVRSSQGPHCKVLAPRGGLQRRETEGESGRKGEREGGRGTPCVPQSASLLHPAMSVWNNSSFVHQLAFKAVGMSLLDLSGKLVKLHRVRQGEGGVGKRWKSAHNLCEAVALTLKKQAI